MASWFLAGLNLGCSAMGFCFPGLHWGFPVASLTMGLLLVVLGHIETHPRRRGE